MFCLGLGKNCFGNCHNPRGCQFVFAPRRSSLQVYLFASITSTAKLHPSAPHELTGEIWPHRESWGWVVTVIRRFSGPFRSPHSVVDVGWHTYRGEVQHLLQRIAAAWLWPWVFHGFSACLPHREQQINCHEERKSNGTTGHWLSSEPSSVWTLPGTRNVHDVSQCANVSHRGWLLSCESWCF